MRAMVAPAPVPAAVLSSRLSVSSIRSIKGMNDALPREAAAFHRVEHAAREVFGRYGFGELRTPIVEEAALFQRGIGDSTDVVEKEMYVFPDRHGTPLALRPEGTASAVRAYLQHNPAAEDPVTRWFYLGPMFRHERPQKGRYRQFQQVGAELFGAANPEADAEMIAMIRDWLAALGLKGIELQLNSIGDSVCRPGYLETLRAFKCVLDSEPDARLLFCGVTENRAYYSSVATLADELGIGLFELVEDHGRADLRRWHR